VDAIDTSTWAVLGLTLTVIGLAVSVVLWRRRGPASGLRAAAWSLLPAAAGLTGTLHLASDIVGSIGDWAVHLVFSPVVWAGIVLAGVSAVLFGVSGVMRARGMGAAAATSGRKAGGKAGGKAGKKPGPLPAQRSGSTAAAPAGKDDGLDDDIEAILRKHGIT